MKKTGLIFVILLLSCGICPLPAQNNDFQVWPSFQANMEVYENLKIHIEEEIRFHENISQVSRQINDLGISYRLNKALRAGLYYRIEADWKNADEYKWRHGLYSDISLRKKINRITLGYRLRLQSAKIERSDPETNLLSGFRHRHKFSADYDIKGIPLAPFLEAELFVEYLRKNQSRIDGIRTWIGMEYTLKKVHTISLKYGIDQEMNTSDPLRAFIIALGYKIDLTLLSAK